MGLTDGVTAVNNVLDARKAYKESKENPTGPSSHAPRKKFPSKTLDAIQNLATYGSDVIGVAKNSLHAEGIVTAASVAEAGGGMIGAVAGVKSVRAARRFGLTTRKYRDVKKIDVPAPVDDHELTRLREAETESHWALAQAYVALERAHDGDGDGLADRLSAALDRRRRRLLDHREGRRRRQAGTGHQCPQHHPGLRPGQATQQALETGGRRGRGRREVGAAAR